MKNLLTSSPIILGGIIPMFLYGLMVFPIKLLSGKLHFSFYILFTGIGVTLVGLFSVFFFSGKTEMDLTKIALGLFNGFLWGMGTLCVLLALLKPKATIAQLAPIYNMNTLIAVLIGIIVFAEWQNVVVWKILLGTFLILTGSWFIV